MLTVTIVTALLLASTAAASIPLTTLIAEQQVSLWKCQDQLQWARTRPSVEPWSLPRSTAYRRWVLRVWTQRAGVCKAALHEQARQWNWQAFTTSMERAVAMCETQLNWHHSTSGYGGAYGFARSSWDAFKPSGYPEEPEQASPWQQTIVERRIRDRFGWSGWGCVTHGGYRYWLGRV